MTDLDIYLLQEELRAVRAQRDLLRDIMMTFTQTLRNEQRALTPAEFSFLCAITIALDLVQSPPQSADQLAGDPERDRGPAEVPSAAAHHDACGDDGEHKRKH